MKAGLEYAISFLERRAARHKKMLSGDFRKSDKYMQLRHHNEMEACLSAAKSLRRKLRSVTKEPQADNHQQPQAKMPAILRAVRDVRGGEAPAMYRTFA